MTRDTLLETALTLHREGYTPLPIKPDGSKSPAVRWTPYIDTQPTIAEVTGWFTRIEADGIGVIAGAASGNLEMFEAEGRAIHLIPQLAQLMTDHGAADLWALINSGWVEITPNAGMHWHYRVSDGPARRNTKLARRPATDTELADKPDEKIKVLFETRGQGGFTVLAPSNGRTHPTGKGWRRVHGGPDTCPVITSEQRDLLYAVTSLLDETPTEPEPAYREPGPMPVVGGLRPGDDYNARASWDDILGSRGWEKETRPGFVAWRRPGKTDPGISATTGRNEHDRLYVFSSSTEFDTEKPYSKFAAYALLEHGGNYADAARALRRAGYGDQRQDRLLTLVASNTTPPTDGTAALNPGPQAGGHPVTLTDHGNAELLVRRHQHHLRYVPSRGQWLDWTGQRWAWCEDAGEAMQAAIDTVQAIQPADDPERKHKHTSLSRRSLEAAVGIARTHPTMRVAADRLDANPHVLNTPGGVLNLRTGKTEPSAANEMHTRITRCAPDADCPVEQWLSYLAQTFDGREELIPFVQRLAGYSATGTTRHHILPFLLGPGKNGKSVFLDVLRTMLGTYAASSPSKFLMAGQQQHETEIARLSGLRLVICSEVNQSDKFDEAKVKVLTGGDGLTARFMNQNHFDFSPTHKLWLMGNHQPRVTGGGESFWRRLRVINFDNTVAPDKMIGDLAERLIEDEGPGILAWIAEGARLAYESGLQEPNSVLIATQTYAAEEDALARFVADRVHLGGGDVVRVKVSEVRSAYEEWCRSEGDQPLSSQVFGRELRIRYGIESKKSNGVRHYAGMTLYAADTDASAETHWSDR